MARVKRNTENGDNAILRAVSGCEDVRECGLHIASRLPQHEDNTALEDRYTVPSSYDGTDYAKLVAEERERARKTTNKYLGFRFATDIEGEVRIYTSEWSVIFKVKDGPTYKIGGSNLKIRLFDGLKEVPPRVELVDGGTLQLEKNGTVAGFVLAGQEGKIRATIRSDKPTFIAQVVPIGEAPKAVRL